MQCRIIMLLIFIECFSVSLLRISPFWLCLHLYFCCIHSRKFILCLFTLFFSETFSIMGPIQHGEQFSYWNSKSNPTFCFIHKQQQAAEFSLKRSPDNLNPMTQGRARQQWQTMAGDHWSLATWGSWGTSLDVTTIISNKRLWVWWGGGGGGGQVASHDTRIRCREWRRWWWLTPGWRQAWRCSAQISPAANSQQSHGRLLSGHCAHWCHSGVWSLLTLMLSPSQAGLHTTRLGHVPLVSGCPSCLRLSLTAHSSHCSAWPRLEAPGAWSRSVHSCSRQSPASSPCPALARRPADTQPKVRSVPLSSAPEHTTRTLWPDLKFSTHGNDSSHTPETPWPGAAWGQGTRGRGQPGGLQCGVWRVYDEWQVVSGLTIENKFYGEWARPGQCGNAAKPVAWRLACRGRVCS